MQSREQVVAEALEIEAELTALGPMVLVWREIFPGIEELVAAYPANQVAN